MGTVFWAHLLMPRFLWQMPIKHLARRRHPALIRGQMVIFCRSVAAHVKALGTCTPVLRPVGQLLSKSQNIASVGRTWADWSHVRCPLDRDMLQPRWDMVSGSLSMLPSYHVIWQIHPVYLRKELKQGLRDTYTSPLPGPRSTTATTCPPRWLDGVNAGQAVTTTQPRRGRASWDVPQRE